ncbi:NACHT domain-containing protein [Rhizobium sp. S152]|uniref:NACHT domain-containing protein n=1 Tax=Rhizobium sp. S152 TaxID=3055038 RepID=UPI0025AA251A|nr:NACHT domain-containing protein [Rhizobium sp. S152]MDM9624574.1 NACHT domain-containing protein [Rhizobium sp. S152]
MIQPGNEFERKVAEFCRRNWPPEVVQTNRMVDGREVDVVIDAKDQLILIECTIDRSKKKAEHDILKLRNTRRVIAGDLNTRPVTGFFITQGDPTPEIHQVASANGSWIEACSFPTFVNRFNCSSTYLIERMKRPFGSVRNPEDDSIHLDRKRYVQVPFRNIEDTSETSIDRIVDDISQKRRTRFVATGDFGVGKSMTFREMFFRFAEQYESGELYRFPIYINLNEANSDDGDDFIDLLERHAKWVGLRSDRDKLVHAWTTDCSILFLDGFDELIRAGFTRLTTSSRDIRYASSHIIRSAIEQSPRDTPILISGRQSYFPNFAEMRQSLGATKFAHVSLQDLKESEVKALYRKINPHGQQPVIMDWLPQRPLLLSYIYFELGDKIGSDSDLLNPLSPGVGWDILLDKLCARETKVARGAEPSQIRRLLERIALHARTNIAEAGRITSLHVADAYRDVMGMEPDLSVQQVLMRFPGLTTGHANEERSFIDDSIYEAAQAGTIVDAIEALASRNDKYLRSDEVTRLLTAFRRTRSSITQLTAQVAASALKKRDYAAKLSFALETCLSKEDHASGNLAADLLTCASLEPELFLRSELKKISIRDAAFPELEISNHLLKGRKLHFQDCIFETLDLAFDEELTASIRFERCRVETLHCSGEVSKRLEGMGLGAGDIEERSIVDGTNSDILEMSIPDGFKVLKIVLRKVFRQAGSGRKKSAFFRGMPGIDGELIEQCLTALARKGLVYVVGAVHSDESVWHANRAHSKRVDFLIETVNVPDDPLLKELQ